MDLIECLVIHFTIKYPICMLLSMEDNIYVKWSDVAIVIKPAWW